MLHQLVELLVVFAGKQEGTIYTTYKVNHLLKNLFGESCCDVREIEFANQAPCHGVAVEYRSIFGQSQTLKGMSNSMPQVERFPDTMLMGVVVYNLLLDLDRMAY